MSPQEKLKSEFLSEEFVCDFMGITKITAQCQRSRGKDHPPYMKLGRKIMYPAKEFYSWVEKRKLIRAIS